MGEYAPYSNSKTSSLPTYSTKERGQPMTTPILELWKAMGHAGIQPDGIGVNAAGQFYFGFTEPQIGSRVHDKSLIKGSLTGHAEAWLIDERGWTMYRAEGRVKYCPPITGQHYSLPDAIRAEAGRGK